jgi:hypothetical protein
MMKSAVSVSLLAILCAALVACGESKGKAEGGGSATAAPEAAGPRADAPVKLISAGFNPDSGYTEAVLQGPADRDAYVVTKLPLKGSKGAGKFRFDASGRASVVINDGPKQRFGVWIGPLDDLLGAQVDGKSTPDVWVELHATILPRMKSTNDRVECPDGVGPCSVRRVPLKGWELSGKAGLTLRLGGWTVPLSPQAQVLPGDHAAILAGIDLGKAAGPLGDFSEPALVPVAVLDGDTVVADGSFRLFPVYLQDLVARAVVGIRQGPLAVAKPGQGTAALWVDGADGPTDPHVRLLGAAAGLGDVATIVLSKRTLGKKLSCGTYGGGGASAKVSVQAYGAAMTAYDRATGKEIGAKTFTAPAKCPRTVAAKKSDAVVSTGAWVDDAVIVGWIQSLAR